MDFRLGPFGAAAGASTTHIAPAKEEHEVSRSQARLGRSRKRSNAHTHANEGPQYVANGFAVAKAQTGPARQIKCAAPIGVAGA